MSKVKNKVEPEARHNLSPYSWVLQKPTLGGETKEARCNKTKRILLGETKTKEPKAKRKGNVKRGSVSDSNSSKVHA